MADDLSEQLDQLVLDNWGLIDDLRQRRDRIIGEVLSAGFQSFNDDPSVRQLVDAGSVLQNGTTYFGIRLTSGGIKDVAQVWNEIQRDQPRMAMKVYSSFRGTNLAIGHGEIKRRILAQLGAMPTGWDDSSQRSTVVSELVAHADESLVDFGSRVAEVAVGQLPIAMVLAEIAAANVKA